eukprot:SAG11_NODE_16767_length_538_cov_1.047836_1_plen_111_part_10
MGAREHNALFRQLIEMRCDGLLQAIGADRGPHVVTNDEENVLRSSGRRLDRWGWRGRGWPTAWYDPGYGARFMGGAPHNVVLKVADHRALLVVLDGEATTLEVGAASCATS